MPPTHDERRASAPGNQNRSDASRTAGGTTAASRPGGASGGLRAGLRTMDYADGARSVRPPAERGTSGDGADTMPAGVPRTPEEIQRSIDHVGVGATMTKGKELGRYGDVSLAMRAGTRLNATASRRGVSISAEPGLDVIIPWLPDAVVRRLRYDFATGAFSASAEGLGPDGLYSKAVAWIADSYFKAKLPAKMRAAGYNPNTDPDVLGTFKSLGSVFGIDPAQAVPGAGGGGGGGEDDPASDLVDPSASLGFHLAKAITIPIAGGEAEVVIPAAARFDLAASLKGRANKPSVGSLTLRSLGKPIELRKITGFAASLQGIDINAITVLPGGRVQLDYELVLEQMANGAVALVGLFALLAGDPRLASQPMPRTRFEELRKTVDAKIAAEVQPRLADLLREYDKALPGISLVEAFGL